MKITKISVQPLKEFNEQHECVENVKKSIKIKIYLLKLLYIQ